MQIMYVLHPVCCLLLVSVRGCAKKPLEYGVNDAILNLVFGRGATNRIYLARVGAILVANGVGCVLLVSLTTNMCLEEKNASHAPPKGTPQHKSSFCFVLCVSFLHCLHCWCIAVQKGVAENPCRVGYEKLSSIFYSEIVQSILNL